ncbi:MAG TPA: hypothetical protein DIU39_09690 [Flavobacteriales bacterium]|nr:hypothetical protein [Flavobacteriales bacterium]|tara:strand:- start:47983 stop:48645 length:663 start_codon:yes stop_codon:yes gene_type:complete
MFKLKKNKEKIFCISFQRTGTTSVGQFFKDHKYKVAGWNESHKNNWAHYWHIGNYEKIFSSKDFKNNQVFEDSPWWHTNFYRFLFHEFPNSKFILLERNPDDWFNSMMSHSENKTLGNTQIHCELYNRLDEFYDMQPTQSDLYSNKIDNLLSLNEAQRKLYVQIYKLRNKEIKLFFEKYDQSRLFTGNLYDKELWRKMGDFFNIKVAPNYKIHANKSLND